MDVTPCIRCGLRPALAQLCQPQYNPVCFACLVAAQRDNTVVTPHPELFDPPTQEEATAPVYLARLWENPGRVSVVIEAGEDATHDSLRRAIPWALRWRDRLLEYQKPWRAGGDTALMAELSTLQEHGKTYRVLADRINRTLAVHLDGHIRFQADVKAARPAFKTQGDMWAWFGEYCGQQENPNPYALDHARGLLTALGFSAAEAESTLQAALSEMAAGNQPFERGQPVRPTKMRSGIRAWRAGRKGALLRQWETDCRALDDGA